MTAQEKPEALLSRAMELAKRQDVSPNSWRESNIRLPARLS